MDEDGTDVTSSFSIRGTGFADDLSFIGVANKTEYGDLVFPYGTKSIGLYATPASEERTEDTLYSTDVFNLSVEDAEDLMLNSKLTLIAFKAVQPNREKGYMSVYGAGNMFIMQEPRYLSGSVGLTKSFKVGSEFSGMNLEEQGYSITYAVSFGGEKGCTPATENVSEDMATDATVKFDSKYASNVQVGNESDYANFYCSYGIGRPFNSPEQYKDAIEKTYAGNIAGDWENKLRTEQRMQFHYIMHTPIPVSKSKVKVFSVADGEVADVTQNYDISFRTGAYYFDDDGLPHFDPSKSTDLTFSTSGVINLPVYIIGSEMFSATRTDAAREGGINTCDVYFQPWTDYSTPDDTIYARLDWYFTRVVNNSTKKGIALLTDEYLQGTFQGVGPYSDTISKSIGEVSYEVKFGEELASVEKKPNMTVSAFADAGMNCTVTQAEFVEGDFVASAVVTPEDDVEDCSANMRLFVRASEETPEGYEAWFTDGINLNRNGKFDITQSINYDFVTE